LALFEPNNPTTLRLLTFIKITQIGYLAEDDQTMGALAETALFAQWFHDSGLIDQIYYARWANGEIDMVFLEQASQKPLWATEVKWSDRPTVPVQRECPKDGFELSYSRSG
jgi:hypothetical protein